MGVVGTHSFVAVGTEEACMVAFLHNYVGDTWLVLLLQAYTGLTNGQQLIIQHLMKQKKTFCFKYLVHAAPTYQLDTREHRSQKIHFFIWEVGGYVEH